MSCEARAPQDDGGTLLRAARSIQRGSLTMVSIRLRCVLLGLCAAFAATPAVAQEPFYKGKRITVLINFAAGGPTDIEGRLFVKHLAKHIDGQPNILVQNMDG